MQNANPIPHTLAEWASFLLVAILGYGASFLPSLFKKKQTDAEIERTKAETRRIDLDSTLSTGDMVRELIISSAQAAIDVERLRRERDFWQGKAQRLEQEARDRPKISSGEHPRMSESD